MSEDRLIKNREQASLLSLGLSDSVIYQKFIDTVEENQLSGKVLDFGAGRGELTKKLVELSIFDEVCGIDLMEKPVGLDTTICWKQADLNEEIEEWSDSFDVILAAEVIEHLENPRLVARQIYKWLKPGGTAILSTPNNESYRAILSLLIRGHFVDFTDKSYPAHITPLVTLDLKRVLSEAGFEDLELTFTDSGAIPRLPRFKWQQISAGLLRGVRFSDNVLIKGIKPLAT